MKMIIYQPEHEAEAIKRFIDAVGFPYSGLLLIDQKKMRVKAVLSDL
jgi:hypothetical protein